MQGAAGRLYNNGEGGYNRGSANKTNVAMEVHACGWRAAVHAENERDRRRMDGMKQWGGRKKEKRGMR